MSEQFTKGPWRYDDGHGIVFDANDDFVCDTMPTGDAAYDANAALIACAPEMYAEIKEYISLLNALINDGYIGYVERRNAAVELLAKARGES